MSVTLSMPIHWLCLRLTWKFYPTMSASPKSRIFYFGLTCDVISDLQVKCLTLLG